MQKQRVVDTSITIAGTITWWFRAGTSPLLKPEGPVGPPKVLSRVYKARVSIYRRLNLHTTRRHGLVPVSREAFRLWTLSNHRISLGQPEFLDFTWYLSQESSALSYSLKKRNAKRNTGKFLMMGFR